MSKEIDREDLMRRLNEGCYHPHPDVCMKIDTTMRDARSVIDSDTALIGELVPIAEGLLTFLEGALPSARRDQRAEARRMIASTRSALTRARKRTGGA